MRLFKQSSLLSVSWFLGLGALLSGVGACSFAPIADVTSLAPAVKGSTISDERAYAEATDQILLTNILRARDGAPLNMGTLASMNGALSVQATLGGSFPFGADLRKIETSSGPSSAVDTFSPSLTGSTSPTYTFTPLNTEGFMLNAVQPVSAAYVLNRWNAGVSRELLMLLFAKEIDIPVARDGTHPAKGVRYLKFINNPDDKNQFAAFRQLVHVLLEAAGDLKAFDVLEPVGPTFDLYSPLNLSSQRQRLVQSMKESPAADKTGGGGTASQSGAEPKVDNSDQGGNSGLKVTIERQTQTTESLSLLHDEALFRQLNSTAFSAITSNSDGQYHFGNYTSDGTLGQMYRVYAAQVVLCVDRKSLSAKKYDIFSAAGSDTASASPAPYVPPPGLMPAHPHRMHSRHGRTSETAPPATSGDSGSTHAGVVTAPTMALVSDATKYALRAQVQFTQSGGPAGGGAPPAAAKGTGAGGNPAAAAGGGGGAAQATTAALQAQRYASIVDDTDCAPEQIVVPPRTEKEFQRQSEGFAHIQWRSISETIEFLGAVLRYERDDPDKTLVTWNELPAPWIGSGEENLDALATSLPGTMADIAKSANDPCAVPKTCLEVKLFDLPVGLGGSYHVNYGPLIYSVPEPTAGDKSAQVVSMLSTLVSLANVSSNITPTAPLQLLPLP